MNTYLRITISRDELNSILNMYAGEDADASNRLVLNELRDRGALELVPEREDVMTYDFSMVNDYVTATGIHPNEDVVEGMAVQMVNVQ